MCWNVSVITAAGYFWSENANIRHRTDALGRVFTAHNRSGENGIGWRQARSDDERGEERQPRDQSVNQA